MGVEREMGTPGRSAPARVSRLARARGPLLTAAGALAVTGALGWALAGKRHEFAAALGAAPLWLLSIAAALQLAALVSRSEAWHACIRAAGGTAGRRRIHCAAGLGNLASILNSQLATAARIAVLRRTAPADVPKVPALIAAEAPILGVEVLLATGASFTLVAPLGLPWWGPVVAIAVAVAAIAALRRLAGTRRHECWSGLAALRSLRAGRVVIGLVLVAVGAQILRNWLLLHAVGVDASVFDATAVLIAMVTLSQLPFGPSVGAAAVVLILGANGVALTAAAGVLLTVTGTVGALCFASWALLDRSVLRRRVAAP